MKAFGQKQNTVFRGGRDFHLNACVGHNGGLPDFERMAEGYLEASLRLVKSLQEVSFGIDAVVYPLVTLFRHGVEIYLKHYAQLMPQLYDETTSLKMTHRLDDNWRIVKPLMRKAFEGSEEYPASETRFETILKCLLEADPDGMHFRYPESKQGEPHLTEWSLINVTTLGGFIQEAKSILFTWSCWISTMLDYEAEMRSNYDYGRGDY